MKIQEKPDYLIFADSAKKGEVSDFPDIGRGWGITIEQTGSKPPLEWMNGAFNRVDKNMLYLLQQGVPEWSKSVKYPANAIIKYNGVLYTAIAENDNSNPATNTTKWKKTQEEIALASLSQAGIVKLSSAIDSNSEITAATSRAIKEVNDKKLSLVGGTITGDLTVDKSNAGIKLSTNNTNYTLSTSATGDAFSFYFPDADNNNTQRLIYTKQDKTFNFKSCDVKINDSDVITIDNVGERVVETFRSDSGWYRKWSDGWVEQGGEIKGKGRIIVNFLVPFIDNNYSVANSGSYTFNNTDNIIKEYHESYMKVLRDASTPMRWYACGYYTNTETEEVL